MTKLGIIGAMQEEIETLLHLMEKKTEKEKTGDPPTTESFRQSKRKTEKAGEVVQNEILKLWKM